MQFFKLIVGILIVSQTISACIRYETCQSCINHKCMYIIGGPFQGCQQKSTKVTEFLLRITKPSGCLLVKKAVNNTPKPAVFWEKVTERPVITTTTTTTTTKAPITTTPTTTTTQLPTTKAPKISTNKKKVQPKAKIEPVRMLTENVTCNNEIKMEQVLPNILTNKELFMRIEYNHSCSPLSKEAKYVHSLCSIVTAAKNYGMNKLDRYDLAYINLNRAWFFNATCKRLRKRVKRCKGKKDYKVPQLSMRTAYGWTSGLFSKINPVLLCPKNQTSELPDERLVRTLCQSAVDFQELDFNSLSIHDLAFALESPAYAYHMICSALLYRKTFCYGKKPLSLLH